LRVLILKNRKKEIKIKKIKVRKLKTEIKKMKK